MKRPEIDPGSDAKARDWVAILLAVGLATSVNIFACAMLWDAIKFPDSTLSENATQVLTGAYGGMVGILGGYLGYKAGRAEGEARANGNGNGGPPAP